MSQNSGSFFGSDERLSAYLVFSAESVQTDYAAQGTAADGGERQC